MHRLPSDNPGESNVIGRFTIGPYGMHKIELGKYKESDPKPTFQVRYHEPHEPHSITRRESKLGDGEVYYLFYNFQNFGSQPCTVTVRRAGPDLRIPGSFFSS